MTDNTSKTVAAETIGCRLNQADTALLFDRLRQAGYRIVPANTDEPVSVMLVNTCTVTGTASQKSRQAARKLKRKHPESCLVIVGCGAGIDREAWESEPGADIVLPNDRRGELVEQLARHFSGGKAEAVNHETVWQPEVFRENANADYPFKTRALLKVQEGCNAFCSYCIVPYARGPERSRDWNEVLRDFQNLLDSGYREIVITGVNTSTYNCNGKCLADLVSALTGFPGDFRVRLSSTEPHPRNIELLELIADNPKICRFLHLPLQHGSDSILKAMNRKYNTEEYYTFVEKARELVPDIHIGSDFIVGFPGETEKQFEEAVAFVRKVAFANLHIFTYSPRKGTPAEKLPGRISGEEMKRRYKILSDIAAGSAANYLNAQVGKLLPVIFERKRREHYLGWSDNYLRVKVVSGMLEKGEITPVLIENVTNDGNLQGRIVTRDNHL